MLVPEKEPQGSNIETILRLAEEWRAKHPGRRTKKRKLTGIWKRSGQAGEMRNEGLLGELIVIAAAAILHGCDEFWTNDLRLGGLGSRLTLRVIPEPAS